MAPRRTVRPVPARPAPAVPALRWLLVLAAVLLAGRLALGSLPAQERLDDGLLPDLPEVRLPGGAADGRHRLRSVTTAPSRPRLGEAAVVAPAVEEAPVPVHRPLVRLDDARGVSLAAVASDPAVAHAAALDLAELHLADGPVLTVAVVDPAAFRALSPPVTAHAPAVWALLERGELLLSPDRAARLGVRAGGTLALADGSTLPVAGAASNGAPPLVDVLVARPLAAARGAGRTILVAVEPGADIPALGQRLREATGARVGPMPPAEPAIASLVGTHPATAEAFAAFTYREASGGRIAIDPAWEEAHIVRADVPVLGAVRCHRLLVPQLRAALERVADAGLADELDAGDYGGCYLPRHIDWNPAASLSMHAWGLALDLNVSTNGLGQPPQLHPDVVEVFEEHGFTWGGRWSRPDGMHFELGRLLTDEELAALAS